MHVTVRSKRRDLAAALLCLGSYRQYCLASWMLVLWSDSVPFTP